MNAYLYKGTDLRLTQTQEEFDNLIRKGYSVREDPPTTEEHQCPFWNTETQVWEIREQERPVGEWSSFDFLLRLTFDERTGIALAAKSNAIVSDFRLLCASSGIVKADHRITIQGLEYIVSLGIITKERMDQILDPYWNP